MFLNLTTGITGLSVVFPSNNTSAVGQVLRIWSREAVAATVSYTLGGQDVRGAAGATGATPTSFAANTNYEWQKVANDTWIRVH
jgi:hypothetical protein